jgi:hypothetical protein
VPNTLTVPNAPDQLDPEVPPCPTVTVDVPDEMNEFPSVNPPAPPPPPSEELPAPPPPITKYSTLNPRSTDTDPFKVEWPVMTAVPLVAFQAWAPDVVADRAVVCAHAGRSSAISTAGNPWNTTR